MGYADGLRKDRALDYPPASWWQSLSEVPGGRMSASYNDAPLITALFNAERAAMKAEHDDPSDDGACNMDTCVLVLSRVRASTVGETGEIAGVAVERKSTGQFWVWLGGGAQASLRTRRMEAAAEALKAQGFEAYVWYALD